MIVAQCEKCQKIKLLDRAIWCQVCRDKYNTFLGAIFPVSAEPVIFFDDLDLAADPPITASSFVGGDL